MSSLSELASNLLCIYEDEVVSLSRQRYCPYCGVKLQLPEQFQNPLPQCPDCGYLAYPAPIPVVLVLIYRGDQILLGRSPRHPAGAYALIAGHIDYGESPEQAAEREAAEEAGVRCRATHYLGSYYLEKRRQLCLTFAARYLDGEAAAADDVEEVRWFNVAEEIPLVGWIAAAVVEKWRSGKGARLN